MTEHRSFKRLVRARMAKTGESYTAARAQLLAGPEPDEVRGAPPVHRVLATSDARIRERTGRGWEEWFDLLDDAGMSGRPHREVARWVAAQLGVVPLAWPAQAVTGSYERARGGRAVGEHEDGFSVSVSRTIAVPAEAAFDALLDPERRARWLDTDLNVRTSTRPRSARFDHADGRVAVTIDAKDAARCTVTVAHSRLADADLADKTRAQWRERLDALKAVLGAEAEKADA